MSPLSWLFCFDDAADLDRELPVEREDRFAVRVVDLPRPLEVRDEGAELFFFTDDLTAGEVRDVDAALFFAVGLRVEVLEDLEDDDADFAPAERDFVPDGLEGLDFEREVFDEADFEFEDFLAVGMFMASSFFAF